jgi:3-oxoacyl-[acyl-carrier protein] reductase
MIPFVCDFSDLGSLEYQLDEVIDELDGIDIIVNNTGGPPKVRFPATSVKYFDRGYDKIVISVIAAAGPSLPSML